MLDHRFSGILKIVRKYEIQYFKVLLVRILKSPRLLTCQDTDTDILIIYKAEQLDQVFVFSVGNQQAMETIIELDQLDEVLFVDYLIVLAAILPQLSFIRIAALRPDDEGLDQFSGLINIVDIAQRYGADENSLLRDYLNEVFVFQFCHGLPDRRPARPDLP